jgi:hypothetical protein
MAFDDLTFIQQANAMAALSHAAYKDICYSSFLDLDIYTDYAHITNNDVHAHIAHNDTHALIAFRGTTIRNPADIIGDLEIWQKQHGPGWVHFGFRRLARYLLPTILDYIVEHRGKKILITGHSLGGAMALYVAQELQYRNYTDITLFTFGMPMLGNQSYVDGVKIIHHRFVNYKDTIPYLPWARLGYRHHGTLHFLNHSGFIVDPKVRHILIAMLRTFILAWLQNSILLGLYNHRIIRYIEKLSTLPPS